MMVLSPRAGYIIPEAAVSLAWPIDTSVPWDVFQMLLMFLKGHAVFRVVSALVVLRVCLRQTKCQPGADARGRP